MRLGAVPRLVPEDSVERLAVVILTFVDILATQEAAPQSNRYGGIIFQIETAKLLLDVFGRLLSMVVRKMGKAIQKRCETEHKEGRTRGGGGGGGGGGGRVREDGVQVVTDVSVANMMKHTVQNPIITVHCRKGATEGVPLASSIRKCYNRAGKVEGGSYLPL
jgi:hypothetical protein